jgi:hypothetical protein
MEERYPLKRVLDPMQNESKAKAMLLRSNHPFLL